MSSKFLYGMALVPVLIASTASAQLWDNGPLVTHPGGGFGGADASRLRASENILGYGHQADIDNNIADDFTITDVGGWHIDSITVFAYQTGGPPFGNIQIVMDILNGVPVSPVTGTYFGGPGTFSGIYRDSETTPGASNRAINMITIDVDADFAMGTHWLAWAAIGDGQFSGPWVPPVSYLDVDNAPNPLGEGPNGMQHTTANGWLPVEDSGSFTPDEFPFIINGFVLPGPGAFALFLVAAGGMGRSRRR